MFDEFFVETAAIRSRNFEKSTGLSIDNMNTNYNEIITQLVINKMLHHVVMS